jgi:hypothetical protein
MKRVSKRGYIEVPSMLFEMSRGRQPGVPVGLSHHRWIVDIQENEINFMCKHHSIHCDPPYNLPGRIWRSIPEDRMVSWLFWEGDFSARETELWHPMADLVRRYNPSGIQDEGEFEILKGEPEEARGESGRAKQEAEALRERLRLFEDVGETGLRVARQIRRVSSRYPRLSSLIRRMIDAA